MTKGVIHYCNRPDFESVAIRRDNLFSSVMKKFDPRNVQSMTARWQYHHAHRDSAAPNAAYVYEFRTLYLRHYIQSSNRHVITLKDYICAFTFNSRINPIHVMKCNTTLIFFLYWDYSSTMRTMGQGREVPRWNTQSRNSVAMYARNFKSLKENK